MCVNVRYQTKNVQNISRGPTEPFQR